jgi:hypothetical protein
MEDEENSDDEPSESQNGVETSSAGDDTSDDDASDDSTDDTDKGSSGGADDGGAETRETAENEASGGEQKSPVEYCNEFIESYSRSSARKLYRALAGQGFDLEEVQLQDWVDLEVQTPGGQEKTVEFEVHREKDGRAVGLVDDQRKYRRTLVVASTGAGPVVASQKWPASMDVHARGDCRPSSSRIEYPLVATSSVDLEPFKFWGLRVIWRLPKSFEKGDHDRDSVYDTIVSVMSSERTATDE